jgi:diketogulonate reductase-like aldo/keto reductase
LLRQGLDAGAGFIDTAESYGTEEVVGAAIAGVRDRVFLATKVSPAHFQRADVIAAAERSLRALRTDRIDLYQLHEPNDAVPLEETLGAVEELIEAGKVRFVGVSNFSLAQLESARRALRRHPLVSNQVRYNLADRTIEGGLLGYCAAEKITVIAYSPLAREFGRIYDCDPRGVLRAVAEECGRTPAQVALNWCLSREAVVVIPKTSSPAHMAENCGASGWRLTSEQVRRLDTGLAARRRGRWESRLRGAVPPGLGGVVKPIFDSSKSQLLVPQGLTGADFV